MVEDIQELLQSSEREIQNSNSSNLYNAVAAVVPWFLILLGFFGLVLFTFSVFSYSGDNVGVMKWLAVSTQATEGLLFITWGYWLLKQRERQLNDELLMV